MEALGGWLHIICLLFERELIDKSVTKMISVRAIQSEEDET